MPRPSTPRLAGEAAAARLSLAIVLALLLGLCVIQVQHGEIFPPHGLGKGDTRIYSWMAIDFPDAILAQRLDSYRVQRALPPAIVYLGIRATGWPTTIDYDAVPPFQLLNSVLLLGTALLWHATATAVPLSMSGRWLGYLLLFVNFACLKFFFYLPVLTDATAFFLGTLLVYGYVARKPFVTWTALLAGAFTWPAFFLTGAPLQLWPRTPLPETRAGWRAGVAAGAVGLLYLVGVVAALRSPVLELRAIATAGLVGLHRAELPFSLAIALASLVWAFYRLANRSALFEPRAYWTTLTARRLFATGLTFVGIRGVIAWYSGPAPSVLPVDVFLRENVVQSILRPAQSLVGHTVFSGLVVLVLIARWQAACRAAQALGLGMTLFLASLVLLSLNSEGRTLLHGLPAAALLACLAVEDLRFPRWAPWAFAALAVASSKIWFGINHDGFNGNSAPTSYPAQYWFMNVGPWMADEMYALQGSLALVGLLVVVLAVRGARQLSFAERSSVWPPTRTVLLFPLVPLAALAVTAGVEWPARVMLARAALRARQDPLSAPDSELGWRNVPGRSVRLRSGEYDVGFDVNRLGLRGPEPRLPKPPGAARVLILGGSQAEGYAVPEAASVRARLEAELTGAGCRETEVLNAGVARYSTQQQALWLSQLAAALRPDLTVVFFNHEDLIEGMRSAGADDDEPEEPRRAAHLPAWLRQPRESVHRFRGSASLRFLSNSTSSAWPAAHRALGAWGLVEYGPPPLDLWPLGPRDEASVAWQDAARSLGRMRDEVSALGGSLWLFDAPSRIEVDPAEWRLILGRYRMSERFWKRDRAGRRLRALSESLGLRLVEARPALEAAQEGAARAYWPEAGTWNERGHALAASALAPPLAAVLQCRAR